MFDYTWWDFIIDASRVSTTHLIRVFPPQTKTFFSSFLFYVISRSLVPVTQLYVSVDASTKDSLKKIDRPLFKDFWPRFLDSLKALGEKVSCLLTQVSLGTRGWPVLYLTVRCSGTELLTSGIIDAISKTLRFLKGGVGGEFHLDSAWVH